MRHRSAGTAHQDTSCLVSARDTEGWGISFTSGERGRGTYFVKDFVLSFHCSNL